MAHWSRRKVLRAALAASPVAARRTVIPAGLVAFATPRPANAWITAALGVVSAVAGIVAANNRSDGGLSGSLQYTMAMLRSMAAQLDSLQTSMQKVIEAIGQLSAEQRVLMDEVRLKALRDALSGAAYEYIVEMRRASAIGSYQAWREAELTRSKLNSIDLGLSKIRGLMMADGAFDPISMICLMGTIPVALAVRVALGEPQVALRSTGDEFLEFIERACDRTNAKSTSAINFRSEATAREQQQR